VVVNELIGINSDRALTPEYRDLADIPRKPRGLPTSPMKKEALLQAQRCRVYCFHWSEACCNAADARTLACHRLAQGYGDAWAFGSQLLGASCRRCRRCLIICERNAVVGNPVVGVKRAATNNNEGSAPALDDARSRLLLEAPPLDMLRGVRNRAILAILLYHGIRREELCRLRLRDIQSRQGAIDFRIKGKHDKIRFVPVPPMALRLVGEYLQMGKHDA
jgi:integrase